MSIDTGRERIDEGRQRRTVDRLTPAAKPEQTGGLLASSAGRESADQNKPRARNEASGPKEDAREGMQGTSLLPTWLRRLGGYGLALLLVGMAVLLHWALWDVLSPTPFLIFYLAWVGAAAFGGLGPGLLATLVSWWCIEFLFDPAPSHIGFHDMASIARLSIFLAGGLAVSMVGEKMRRSRIYKRRQGRELAGANAALRASEEKYRLLVENSKDITWTVDLQGRWTFISSNMEKVTGYRADELIGKVLWDFLAPESHDLVKDKLRRRVRGEDLPPYEVMFVGKDGRHMPFEVLAASIVGAGGNVVGVQGVSRDITERKRAEQDLNESRNKYQALIETTADFIWEMDASGKYTYCSPQMKDLWGYEPKDMIGKTPFDVMPPEDGKQAIESFMALAKSPQPFTGLEASSYDSQGRLITVEISGVPFFDADGRLLGYRGISRDVTERRRAQEALAESRRKYRGLVERINDWVWEIDAKGVYTYSSPRAQELLGYAPEEIVGKTPFDFMPPAEAQRVWNAFEPIWLERKPLELLENTLVRKDGRPVTVETSGMPVFADDGSFLGYMGIDRDVTARKWAEEQLRRSEQDLNRAQAVAQTGSWRLDVRRDELLWSHETHRIFGIPDGTPMTYETFLAAVHPEDREYVDRKWTVALRGEPYDIEHRILAEGRLKWVRERAELEFDEVGTLIGGFGTVQDITERKRAEEALRASRSMLQSVMDNVPQGVFWKDRHSTYLGCNKVFARAAGLASAAAIVGKTDYDLPWSPEQTASFREYDRRIMENDAPEYHIIEQQREVNGKLAWLETNKVPLHDAQGNVIGILGTYEDITERKRAEEALRKSEEKFAKAFRSSPIAIAVTRLRDGRILDANEAMLKLLHFTPDEVIGHTTRDLDIWVDLRDRAQFTQMLSTAGSVRDLEYRLRTKDGAVVTIHLSAELLEFGGEPCMLATLVDVTERERAAEALRREKTFTDKLLNAPRDTVFLFEPATGKPIRWNKRFAEVSGYDDEEIAGMKAPDDFFDEHDLKKAREATVKVLAEGQGVVELSLVTKRGVHIPFEYAATVVETEDGKTLFLSIGRDITERKRAEEALRESEERFRTMADGSPNPIWVTDAEGERIFANKQYLEYFGISEQEMKGGEWKPFLHPEDAPPYVNSFMLSLKEHRPFSAEARVRRADGDWRWIESHGEPRLSIEGEFLGFVAITQDITARKRAEEALQASEEKYRFLVENSKDITWMIDLQGRWTFISSNVENVVGYRVDEVIGRTIWDFLAPECHDGVKEKLRRRRRGEEVLPYEVLVVGNDGRRIPFELHTAPIVDDAGNIVGVQGVSRDITERKKAEEALREWNATLESKVAQRTEELEHRAGQLQKLTLELTEAEERERERLAEILHDDLQQVLAAAKFQMGLLTSRVRDDAESHEIAEQARDLLGDAIAKSRSLSHELSAPVLSRSDLSEAFEWLAEQMQTKHGFTVHLDLGGRIELASEPLRVLLYKAAQELLFNASKHAGVHEAKLRLRHRRGRLQLLVSDAGRGVDFTEPGHNLGFGLLSIRERVEYLGGRLRIRSAIGKGSIFVITVPDAERSP